MLTLPAPNATRSTSALTSSLVVRLELPDSDHRNSPGAVNSTGPDLRRLAQAVEDLVRAVAPLSHAITARRTLCKARSHQFGLLTTSAR